MTKLQSLLEDFQNALIKLEQVLKMDKNDVVRDSAIKRFEIVFELAWKTAKAFLEQQHNATCISPKTCFKEAFLKELITHDEFWVNITSIRNYTAHTYKEKMAEWVYNSLPESLTHFSYLLQNIKNQIAND